MHSKLEDPYTLPPKRILSTTFVPSAWADDTLIAERKAGLSAYINALLASPTYQNLPVLASFLKTSAADMPHAQFNLEDALPSTLSRTAALSVQKQLAAANDGEVKATATPIAAAYYPDWSVDSWPPENLDYSKFDVLFFGT